MKAAGIEVVTDAPSTITLLKRREVEREYVTTTEEEEEE
jgi:hypothetical protein